MRGGRNMGARGMKTGEGSSDRNVGVTVSASVRTGPTFGSPRNPQHEQMPLQVSGAAGSGWLTRDWCEEEALEYGPSHRSQ
jgi:hypothetical protein